MRDAIVRFNKALANEERMEIIRLLLEHKVLYAKEIQKHFYLEQSTASHHLNILKKANIIQSVKRGRFVYYELNASEVRAMLTQLSDRLLGSDAWLLLKLTIVIIWNSIPIIPVI